MCFKIFLLLLLYFSPRSMYILNLSLQVSNKRNSYTEGWFFFSSQMGQVPQHQSRYDCLYVSKTLISKYLWSYTCAKFDYLIVKNLPSHDTKVTLCLILKFNLPINSRKLLFVVFLIIENISRQGINKSVRIKKILPHLHLVYALLLGHDIDISEVLCNPVCWTNLIL